MNKYELASLLKNNYNCFLKELEALSDEDFHYAPEGKWPAAQQLDHLYRSMVPVNLAMWVPKFVLRKKFGVANRPSKTYEALVEKYKIKLAEGGKASGSFIPAPVAANQKKVLLPRLNHLVQKLARKTEKHTEETLDRCILPHPLLGQLTLREMLYFTAYHVQHHRELVQTGLETKRIINIE